MRLFIISVVLCLSGGAFAEPRIQLDSVWIALNTDDSVASSKPARVVLGTDVHLSLVLQARVNGKKRYFSTRSHIRKSGRKIPKRLISPWPNDFPSLTIEWRTVEPSLALGIYDNTGTFGTEPHSPNHSTHPTRWHWCPITYKEHALNWGSVWTHKATARPKETPDQYGGLGTMRYAAIVRLGDQRIRTSGSQNTVKGGLSESVARVSYRKDNTFVGYMTELLNVPYVYGSASPNRNDANHQSEKALGADCADLIVYGWRRGGKRLKYTWSQGLKSYTRRVKKVLYVGSGQYTSVDGNPVRFDEHIRPGDILLWGRHVAIITEIDSDKILTKNTKILHTIWGSPEIVPLNKIGYGFDKTDFEIRRIK